MIEPKDLKSIVRVQLHDTWRDVQRGTFRLVPFLKTDLDGYRFDSFGATFVGPLSSILGMEIAGS